MILFVILVLAASVLPVHADMGPKPSFVIRFHEKSSDMWATLLSFENSSGPYKEVTSSFNEAEAYATDPESVRILKEIRDACPIPEGWHLLEFADNLIDGELAWTYYPPGFFRLLVYNETTQEYIITQPMKRYAFSVAYLADIRNGTVELSRDYDLFDRDIRPFLIRCLLTIALEMSVGLIMGIRSKKGILIIAMMNVCTQVFLNLIFSTVAYYNGSGLLSYLFIFLPMEMIIFVIEAVIYSKFLKAYCRWPVLYAFIANVLTAVLGYFLII